MSNQIYRVSYVQDYSLNTLYFKANSKVEVQEKFLKQNSNLKESQIVSIESLEDGANSSFDFSNYLKQIASDKAIRAMVIGGLLLTGLYFGSQKYTEYKQQKLIEEFENEHKEISPQEMQQNHNEEYEEEEYEPTPLNQPNQNSKQNQHTELHTKVSSLKIISSSQKERVANPINSNKQNLPIILTNNKLRLNATYNTIGNRIHFKINAQNVFANAKGGLSVSIPALRYDKDIYSISQNGFDSAKIYPAGSSLWSGSLRRKITSSYLLIEGWSNRWNQNTQKSLEFSVDKSLIEGKTVNVRAVLVKNHQEYILPTSGATDQQGYPVKQITVTVQNASNDANSRDTQNAMPIQSTNKTALQKVLNSWNRVMNSKDTSTLNYLYANELKYYGKQFPRNKAIKDKQRALSKYPEFSQQIKNVTYEEITQNLYKVSFDKYVKASSTSEEKLYPSYLYIKKINSEWRIVEEGDKVTDSILSKKMSNANSGLYVCYDKKEVTASGVHYIGCQRVNTSCKSNSKLHFGKYNNYGQLLKAFNRCKKSQPKFIDSGQRDSVKVNYYIAKISSKDHYNKRGNKLRKVADILQQDRANFYKYGIRDREDTADNYFFKKENRFKIRKMLKEGYISGDSAHQIINGTPFVKVEIDGNSINVSLYGKTSSKHVKKLIKKNLHEYSKKSLKNVTKIGYLMWQDDGRKLKRNWYGAKRYCERLKLGGFTDWRLPSKNELIYLYRNKYKLKHRIDGNYISSYTNTNEFGSKSYWLISFYDGYTTWRDVSNDYDVICVR